MQPWQAKQASPRHPLEQEKQDMSPGSNRKKPTCHKCGYPMEGHKRPYGAPVCPREGSSPPRSYTESSRGYSPAWVNELPDEDGPVTPTASPPPPLVAPYIKRRMPSPDFTLDLSGSGHRSNPNWVDRDGTRPNPAHVIPARSGSWVSTESGSHGTPARRRQLRPAGHGGPEVIDVDAHAARAGSDMGGGEMQEPIVAEDTSDIQSNSSSSSSRTILQHMSRSLSMVLPSSSPLASIYSSPREDVSAIQAAAQRKGYHTAVYHPERSVKTEPTTPSRMPPTREHSWLVAVGRDPVAVNALITAQTPRKSPRALSVYDEQADEPYSFEQGLDRERNESVGTYPVPVHRIRNTFFDTLFAGAVGGLVMFYCLSNV